MVLYDHNWDESEIEIWKKAYAVDELGVPILYGDEKILAEFENRKATLEVQYKRSQFKHTRICWRIFVTN